MLALSVSYGQSEGNRQRNDGVTEMDSGKSGRDFQKRRIRCRMWVAGDFVPSLSKSRGRTGRSTEEMSGREPTFYLL
jgi:hypothetical protein